MNSDVSRRDFVKLTGAAAICGSVTTSTAWAARKKKTDEPRAPHIVFVTGDDEYRSEITMPFMAQLLARDKRLKFKCTVVYATNPETGERNPKYQKNIEGLEALTVPPIDLPRECEYDRI